MSALDARVSTRIRLSLAESRVKLAEAEDRRNKAMGMQNQLRAHKAVKSARGLVEGWEYIASLMDAEPADDADAEKEFPS